MTVHAEPANTPQVVLARSIIALSALALLVAVAIGLGTDVQIFTHRSQQAAIAALADPASADLAVGEPIRTSFGAFTVDGAQVDNGLSAEDLGGMSHGVSSLVAQGLARVEVMVTFTNTTAHPVILAAKQFRLVTLRSGGASSSPLLPTGTTLLAGELASGATIDTRVSFVVPTDGATMRLQYHDPGSATPVQIVLGRTNHISRPRTHQH